MAKKKQILGFTGDQESAEEARLSAAKKNLQSFPEKLKQDLEATGGELHSYLKETFGAAVGSKQVTWSLASGATASFFEVELTYEQVQQNTMVTFDVNGRDQSLLTKESLEDLNSLNFQQFYPAVGREVEGCIDVLDGSRRRAWFLLQEGKIASFRILVTQDDISTTDAKALAKQLQTAKEHNLYELGRRFIPMKEAGMTQQEIAKSFSISQSRVSKAMKAATINQEIYALFYDINELSGADYAELAKIETQIIKSESKYQISLDIERGGVDSVMMQLRKLIKTNKSETSKSVTVPLVTFDDKNKYAKKIYNKTNRRTTYEFQRLTTEQQAKIDETISNLMTQIFGEN